MQEGENQRNNGDDNNNDDDISLGDEEDDEDETEDEEDNSDQLVVEVDNIDEDVKVVSVDIDPICVNVTRNNIGKFWDGNNWDSHVKSVFDLNIDEIGKFDVVYSWGVLHHTGAMYDAIDCAIKLLKSKGQMLIGL